MNLPTFAALAMLAAAPLAAKVSLAPIFTDHAVLQRDRPVPIWGSARPGETVTVQFHGVSASATADAAGAWQAVLPAMPASNYPCDLMVRGDNQITLEDVAVGEVWVEAGERDGAGSPLPVANWPKEMTAAHYPLIRQYSAGTSGAGGRWEPCSPETVAHFLPPGYFFARELRFCLSVPIGIVDRAAVAASAGARRFPDIVQPVAPYALRGALWCGQSSGSAPLPLESLVLDGRDLALPPAKPGQTLSQQDASRQLAAMAVAQVYGSHDR